MKTLSELKRKLQKGVTVTMVHHGYSGENPLLNVPRKIQHVQSNAIQFESKIEGKSGSWLFWPAAKDLAFFESDENKFAVWLDDEHTKNMVYQIQEGEV